MEDPLEIIRKRFEQDRYAKGLGIVLDNLTKDAIRMHMRLREDMLNLFCRPHGGVIYSLADAAFSVLGNNTNNLAVALECSITYHASPDPGALLVAEGHVLSTSPRTGAFVLSVHMETDGTRTLIATMKSVSYRTGRKIDPDVRG